MERSVKLPLQTSRTFFTFIFVFLFLHSIQMFSLSFKTCFYRSTLHHYIETKISCNLAKNTLWTTEQLAVFEIYILYLFVKSFFLAYLAGIKIHFKCSAWVNCSAWCNCIFQVAANRLNSFAFAECCLPKIYKTLRFGYSDFINFLDWKKNKDNAHTHFRLIKSCLYIFLFSDS